MELSIIIVNYNTGEYVDKCLNSIKSNILISHHEVIVVDNNSSENYIKSLPAKFPEFSFYFLNTNKGFGAGCNYGVSKAKGKYILFLNPDVEIIDNSSEKLLHFLDKNPSAGACSGLTTDEYGNISYSYNNFPDLSWEFKQATGIGLMKTISKLNNSESILKNEIFKVGWFHAAFLIVRKSVFDKVGGFDDNIFLYYEDVDLQKKICETEGGIYCLPYVRVLHHTQSSVKNEKVKHTYHYHLNLAKLYYWNKHSNFWQITIIRVFYLFGTLLRLFKTALSFSKEANFKNKLKEYLIVLKIYAFKYNVKTTQVN